MPPRHKTTKTTKAKATPKRKRRAVRKKSKPTVAHDPFARARWISTTYGVPYQTVWDGLHCLDADSAEAFPNDITWEMIRAYDTRNLLLDREKEFVRKLLASNDPRIQDSVERCLIANEKTEPVTYISWPRRELTRENSMARIERDCTGKELPKRSTYRRAHILPSKELQFERPHSAYPISQVEIVRVHCKQCKHVMEIFISDASPLFQSGNCPFCRHALFSRRNVENEPFMLLLRALQRFKEFENNYKVEFLLCAIDE
jgi:hypothetical protein